MASSEDIIKIHKILLTVILIIVAFVQGETYSENSKSSSSSSSSSGFQNQLFTPPSSSFFLTRNNTKVMAQLGGLAILPCALRFNSPATVTWIRRRDFQLLTVGLSTHSSDDRFLVEHARHMGHWSLRIKSVRDVDKGLYECQLSIYPTQSIFVELKVVEAVSEISGAPDLHIDEGSTLRLECKLKRATEYPSYVFWFHNSKMINYDTEHGFSVTTLEPSSNYYSNNYNNNVNPVNTNESTTMTTTVNNNEFNAISATMLQQAHTSTILLTTAISILSIREVHFKHAGNYTCSPSNAKPAGIMVHVLRGEKPAAMQHANRSTIDDGKNSFASSSASSSSSSSSSLPTSSSSTTTINLLKYTFLFYYILIINYPIYFYSINKR